MKFIIKLLGLTLAMFSLACHAEGSQDAEIYFKSVIPQQRESILKRMVPVETKSYIAGRAVPQRERGERYTLEGSVRKTWPMTLTAGDCPGDAAIACDVNIFVEVEKHQSIADKYVCKRRAIDPEVVVVTQKQNIKWKLHILNGNGRDRLRFSADKDDFMVIEPPYIYREFHPKKHLGTGPHLDGFQITDNHKLYPYFFNYQFELDYAYDGVNYESCTGIDPIIFNS